MVFNYIIVDMYKSDVEGEIVYVFWMNFCDDGKYCVLNLLNKCLIVCLVNCNCLGLLFYCFFYDVLMFVILVVLYDY